MNFLDQSIQQNPNIKIDAIEISINASKDAILNFKNCVWNHNLKLFTAPLKKFKPPIIMELAPYLYKENGYDSKQLLDFILNINYSFYEMKTFKKIKNIYEFSNNINDGTSINVFLK